jgi:succinate dehydrogenase/fumarate reductase cytochrome b subunit
MKSKEEMSYAQFIQGTLIRVLFRFTLFIAIAYFLVSEASKPYFYLASACILSLCLALSNTARFAWFLKILGYLFYAIICLVLLLYIPFIGIAGIWLLFYTIKQQNQTHQAA